ncbi:MAG TPA: hypothetical protein DEP20_01515 [Fusobacteria bacterium]|nr:hypothetical protein [Fusobacteriota bacterium]
MLLILTLRIISPISNLEISNNYLKFYKKQSYLKFSKQNIKLKYYYLKADISNLSLFIPQVSINLLKLQNSYFKNVTSLTLNSLSLKNTSTLSYKNISFRLKIGKEMRASFRLVVDNSSVTIKIHKIPSIKIRNRVNNLNLELELSDKLTAKLCLKFSV